jgi:hypothetical protein
MRRKSMHATDSASDDEDSPIRTTRHSSWSSMPSRCSGATCCGASLLSASVAAMLCGRYYASAACSDRPFKASATGMQYGHEGRFSLMRNAAPVLSASAVPPNSLSVTEADEKGCLSLELSAGGALHVDIASGGYWYGGPSLALAQWPASRARIVRQPWRSNDMLSDRDRLGSVLEGAWLTSSGVTLSVRSYHEGALEISMNEPCGGAAHAAAMSGELCFFNTATARAEGDPPIRI